ncbi:hypothetical protein PO902_14190 [Planococcus maritimus]|nr:hypothetical protein [Planococcus sp. SK3692]MDE4086193.1 hypothetical protein [Planococcus maritimus]
MKTQITGEELRLIRTLRNARVIDVANVVNRAASAVCYVEAGNRTLDELQSQEVMTQYDIDEDLLNKIRQTIKLSKL